MFNYYKWLNSRIMSLQRGNRLRQAVPIDEAIEREKQEKLINQIFNIKNK